MPIFEYVCAKFGKNFEKLASRKDADAVPCPHCGAEKAERQLSAVGGIVSGKGSCAVADRPCPGKKACHTHTGGCCPHC